MFLLNEDIVKARIREVDERVKESWFLLASKKKSKVSKRLYWLAFLSAAIVVMMVI